MMSHDEIMGLLGDFFEQLFALQRPADTVHEVVAFYMVVEAVLFVAVGKMAAMAEVVDQRHGFDHGRFVKAERIRAATFG